MIQLHISGFRWGTDDQTVQDPETGEDKPGVVLSILDEDSQIRVSSLWAGEGVEMLVLDMVTKGLTPEARERVAKAISEIPTITVTEHDNTTKE